MARKPNVLQAFIRFTKVAGGKGKNQIKQAGKILKKYKKGRFKYMKSRDIRQNHAKGERKRRVKLKCRHFCCCYKETDNDDKSYHIPLCPEQNPFWKALNFQMYCPPEKGCSNNAEVFSIYIKKLFQIIQNG